MDDKVIIYRMQIMYGWPYQIIWYQQGIIQGPPNSMFGETLSMSNDGKTLAIGASSANTYRGLVQVWRWNDEWVQLGSTINGQTVHDRLGSSIDLASYTLHLAIGSTDKRSNASRGSVRIYRLDSQDEWVQQGPTIYGDDSYDNFGGIDNSISITADGGLIAVGSSAACKVKCFRWNGIEWNQMGSTIYGVQFSSFGSAVALKSLNAGRTVLAVSAPYENSWQGTIRVFDWESGSSSWTERAGHISREGVRGLGFKMKMSGDGETIACASSLALMVFDEDGSGGWVQRGADLINPSFSWYGGSDMPLDLSRYGYHVIAGLPNDEDGSQAGDNIGEVRSFEWW